MRLRNLNSLRMFDAAARHLNFRLASEELHLTQGAIAQQIRKLEADLGEPLFVRQARGLALTEKGRSFSQSIAEALSIIDTATQDVSPETTSITVSVPPSFASKWLVPRLYKFAAIHPDIEVIIDSREALANFKNDGVDIAIRRGIPPFEGLDFQLLSPMNLCAVCSPDYYSKMAPVNKVTDLCQHRLIHGGHNYWATIFDEAGVSMPQNTLRFNQAALAMDAAASGEGIALVPELLILRDIQRKVLVEVWCHDRIQEQGYYIVYPAKKIPVAAEEKMIGWLLSEISS
ncbi:MAG: LysR substrate-binding domain-containing protein [Sneathiella sp.]